MQAFWINELGGVFGTDVTMTWIWDCVTPAAMRNQGHYTEFLKALRHKFRDHELLIYCHAHNAASYRAIRRAGFLPWANVTQHPRRTSIDILQTRFGHHLRAVAPAQRT